MPHKKGALFKTLALNKSQAIGYYDLPLNAEMIQITTSKTTITAIMPTAAPALKIPPITEQLLSIVNNNAPANKISFFIGRCLYDFN